MSRRAKLATLVLVVGSCGVVSFTCAHRPSSAAGHAQGQLVVDGRERTFIAHHPQGLGPFPLVVALHGRLGSGAQMLRLTALTSLAQQQQFIAVYPDGIDRSWADGRGTSPASRAGVDDVAFLTALIDDFVAHRGADPSRVYVVGMSNGGFMALTLACRASKRLAGVGAVTASLPASLPCTFEKPLPVALVMADTDPVVPFAGGELEGGRGTIVGAVESFTRFAELNGCRGVEDIVQLADLDPADGTRVERRQCRGRAAVRLDVVRGGGHTWPGGDRYLPERMIGKTSNDLNASEALWSFFTTEG